MDFLQGLLFFPSSLPGLEVRVAAGLIFLGAAAYYDFFNKKWVPNSLLYAFVLAGIALNLVFFDPSTTYFSLALGGIVFGFFYLMYRAGHLGGADVYALAGVSFCIPFMPRSILGWSAPAPYPFILSVLAPTGVAFMAFMLVKSIPAISRKIAGGEISFTLKKLSGPLMLLLACIVFTTTVVMLPFQISFHYIALLSFLSISLVFFSLFKDEIKEGMIEYMPPSNLQEEDVVVIEKIPPEFVKMHRILPTLNKKSIALFKKSKMEKVPVLTGMPFFLPFLFAGVLFTIIFGDLLSLLISLQ